MGLKRGKREREQTDVLVSPRRAGAMKLGRSPEARTGRPRNTPIREALTCSRVTLGLSPRSMRALVRSVTVWLRTEQYLTSGHREPALGRTRRPEPLWPASRWRSAYSSRFGSMQS